jgi:hypothetical protein
MPSGGFSRRSTRFAPRTLRRPHAACRPGSGTGRPGTFGNGVALVDYDREGEVRLGTVGVD